jgi:hypothetical protein
MRALCSRTGRPYLRIIEGQVMPIYRLWLGLIISSCKLYYSVKAQSIFICPAAVVRSTSNFGMLYIARKQRFINYSVTQECFARISKKLMNRRKSEWEIRDPLTYHFFVLTIFLAAFVPTVSTSDVLQSALRYLRFFAVRRSVAMDWQIYHLVCSIMPHNADNLAYFV